MWLACAIEIHWRFRVQCTSLDAATASWANWIFVKIMKFDTTSWWNWFFAIAAYLWTFKDIPKLGYQLLTDTKAVVCKIFGPACNFLGGGGDAFVAFRDADATVKTILEWNKWYICFTGIVVAATNTPFVTCLVELLWTCSVVLVDLTLFVGIWLERFWLALPFIKALIRYFQPTWDHYFGTSLAAPYVARVIAGPAAGWTATPSTVSICANIIIPKPGAPPYDGQKRLDSYMKYVKTHCVVNGITPPEIHPDDVKKVLQDQNFVVCDNARKFYFESKLNALGMRTPAKKKK
jgi:hypothetical protein